MSRTKSPLSPILSLIRRLASAGTPARRAAAVAIPLAVLALMIGLVVITGGTPVTRNDPDQAAAGTGSGRFGDRLEVGGDGSGEPDAATVAGAGGRESAAGSGNSPPAARMAGGGALVPAPTDLSAPLPGVTDKEILVAYYWKGDRTRTSPYLAGSGVDANLDEGQSFTTLVEYINRHADGGATLMGFPFDLHGRKLKGVVLEAGSSPEEYAAVASRLTKEIRPAFAVSAHGSLSSYVCPQLAAAGIHNLSTFDVAPGLVGRTGGYCLPSGAAWDRQVQVTTSYLAGRMGRTDYAGPEGNGPRKFGVIWAEYPGLVESAPRFVEGLKRAGVNVAATATLSADLTEAQQQAGNAVARMRAAGVNTIVFPDAGAPLSFTPAAESQQYRPDYYVWPCSGMDTQGMVRLFPSAQWERASGLSCYDDDFQTDLANDERTRSTEWYRQYRSVRDDEPPASTGLVYQSLLPLIAALTAAGPDLDIGSFRKGLDDFGSYRYSGINGRSNDPRRLLLDIGSKDRSLVGDFTEVAWSSTAPSAGGGLPGRYEYPDAQKRYPATHRW